MNIERAFHTWLYKKYEEVMGKPIFEKLDEEDNDEPQTQPQTKPNKDEDEEDDEEDDGWGDW